MEKNCIRCNKKFSVNLYRYKTAKYCSLSCRYVGQKDSFKDVTGQKFGKLTAIKRIGSVSLGKSKTTGSLWLWQCDCGVEKELTLNVVVCGNTKSCGCLFKNMERGIDYTGQRFGCLVAVKRVHHQKKGRKTVAYWECVCDCGKTKHKVTAGNLRQGKVKTCGCRMNVKGENAYNWTGGVKYDSAGYKYLYRPEHPNKSRKGYVAEHRLVMEQKLGRYLTRKEEVHHLNAIKDDNRPENLELWSGSHPRGARVKDLIKFAHEILDQYGDIFPE